MKELIAKSWRLETSSTVDILSNGINTLLYDSSTLNVAAVTDETAKVIEILKIPRSYEVFVSLWNKSHPDTVTDELNDLLSILVSEGYLVSENISIDIERQAYRQSEYSAKPPKSVALNVTKKCNLACEYCYNKTEREQSIYEELSTEEWSVIVNDMIDYGVKEFHVTGGEPLLRKDLFPLFKDLKSRGVVVNLNTNATLIKNTETARALKNTFNSISISLDSFSKSEHEYMRGEDTFDRTVNGAKNLTKAMVNWQAQMVCSTHNVYSIKRTEQFVESLGGSRLGASIIYDPNMPSGKFSEIISALDLSVAEVSSGIFSDFRSDVVSEDKTLSSITIDIPCAAARGECSIDHAGNLYPCRLMTLPEMCCGNLLNHSFKFLWEESEVLKRVREIDYKAIEPCRDCSLFRLCRGGCRAMAQRLSGDLMGYPGDAQCANKKRVIFDKLLKSCVRQRNERIDSGQGR